MAKKKTTTRTAASNGTKPKQVKIPRAEKARSKAELYGLIAEQTDLSKKDVANVFDAMSNIMQKDLAKRTGPEEFAIPGLMKITVQTKKATKARPGRNPFTGEEIMIKAKPARKAVKVRPLKNLKEMV